MNQIFILLIFLSAFGITKSNDSIDFNHKKVNKEISRTFDLDDYNLMEIESLRHLATNGEILGKYYSIIESDKAVAYLYIGRVFTCPAGGCDENINSSRTSEYFDYLILYDHTKKLANIAVTNYQATHGQEVCARGWLRQFTGFNGSSQLQVGKNIDSISGATKSTHSITEDIIKRTYNISKIQL